MPNVVNSRNLTYCIIYFIFFPFSFLRFLITHQRTCAYVTYEYFQMLTKWSSVICSKQQSTWGGAVRRAVQLFKSMLLTVVLHLLALNMFHCGRWQGHHDTKSKSHASTELKRVCSFFVWLRLHLTNPNVPGLEGGGGLGEIDRTDVTRGSNKWFWCTDQGFLKRFDMP